MLYWLLKATAPLWSVPREERKDSFTMRKETYERVSETFAIESRAILEQEKALDMEAFSRAVDALCKCGTVITCASGHSGIAAKKFAHAMSCIERPGVVLSPAEAVHGGLGVVQKDDVVVFVSRGGKTAELLPVIDVANEKGATIITLTENLESPLAKAADIVLPLKIEKETDKYNCMATTSFTVTVALFDALWMAVMEETDYKKEQFALIHPGGAVGARLNHR